MNQKEFNNYYSLTKEGREKIAAYQKTKSIIGDTSGIPGIGTLSEGFIQALATRALFRGNEGEKIIIPQLENTSLRNFVQKIQNLLEIKPSQVLFGDFETLVPDQLKREPYMRTEYYYNINTAPTEIVRIINTIKALGNKGLFMEQLKQINPTIIPEETETYEGIYINGEYLLPTSLIKDVISRIQDRKNFIVKGGDGASGTNMVIFKYLEENEEYNIIIGKEQKFFKVHDLDEREIINILNKFITDKKTFLINEENKKIEEKPQIYVVQSLIDINEFEEKSIGLFIITNKKGDIEINLTHYSFNLTEGTIHVGNVELPILTATARKKIKNTIKKLIKKINMEFKINFSGHIGLDMFVNRENPAEIKIIECNPRYVAPTTPSMLVYKLEKITGLHNLTRTTLQKFNTNGKNLALEKDNHPEIRKFNLLFNGLNSLFTKGLGFIPFTPPFNKTHQGIILIGTDTEKRDEMKQLLKKYIKI